MSLTSVPTPSDSAWRQYYLRESRDVLLLDSVEMGAGLAMQYAKAISPLDRQESE